MIDKHHILYVDDEQNNLLAFKSVFRRFYEVTTALCPEEAIDIMNQKDIDLLLTDQKMPNMTGVELCTYAKSHFPKARRIIITGYKEKDLLEKALQQGHVQSIIMKPWDTQQLKSEIESML